jgi:hypothetical protein
MGYLLVGLILGTLITAIVGTAIRGVKPMEKPPGA